MAFHLSSSPIAIVGMACVYPGAEDPEAYWKTLMEGRAAFAPLPSGHWDWERYGEALQGPAGPYRLGASLPDRPFTWQRYRVPPTEEVFVHRMEGHLIRAVEKALEDAGPAALPKDRTRLGLVAGSMGFGLGSSRLFTLRTHLPHIREALHTAPGFSHLTEALRSRIESDFLHRFDQQLDGNASHPDLVAWTAAGICMGRVCNLFDIQGPHLAVDSGESSSLAALEFAVRQLEQAEQDVVLVAGVSPALNPPLLSALARMGWLGSTPPHPFDASSRGALLGEGVGVLALKRLTDALRDGNRVDAVLRGIGSASQGRRRVPTAPAPEVVAEAIQRAYARAGYGLEEVDFIESHGVGHPEWDAAELEALQKLCGARERPLWLGASKSLVGHQLGGAGMSGLLKTVLALREVTLPGERTAREPLEGLGGAARLQQRESPGPWPAPPGGVPRRAGVTALSSSGTHYHVTLERFEPDHHARLVASLPAARQLPSMRVAVVGMGTVLPGAPDVETYWRNLVTSTESIIGIPRERWSPGELARPFGDWKHEKDTALIYLETGAFVTRFSPVPPPLAPRSSEAMDRSQQWLLECVRQAFGSLRQPPPAGSRTSVVVGFSPKCERELSAEFRVLHPEFEVPLRHALDSAGLAPEVRERLLSHVRERATAALPPITEDTLPGYQGCFHAARIGFAHDLRGPCLAVDSACASSLAAVEAACRNLESRECDSAIVAAAWAGLTPEYYNMFSYFRVLSPGKQDPFGPEAQGFIPGEGAAVLVLKREEDARRDGDPILAIIRSVAGSSDGRGKFAYAVNPQGLSHAVKRALEVADVAPESVPLIEGHGISVPAGDVAELETYARHYGHGARTTVSSLKGNIGHVHATAGMAGLVKTILSMQRGMLLPVPGFQQLHPDVDLQGAHVTVQARVEPWPEGRPRRAAVTSYGMGGTNYHLILDAGNEAPPQEGGEP